MQSTSWVLVTLLASCLCDCGTSEGTADGGPAACTAAGGQCVQGVEFCGNVGPGATPESCLSLGLAMLCCNLSPDAPCTTISGASYDQSCTQDSDCVPVAVGNACDICIFACYTSVSAINKSALPAYTADVKKTPGGNALCGCPAYQTPIACCQSGRCQADPQCTVEDASADAADEGP